MKTGVHKSHLSRQLFSLMAMFANGGEIVLNALKSLIRLFKAINQGRIFFCFPSVDI